MLAGIGSLPRFLHGGYFGARGIKTSRGRANAVSSVGNSSFPNSPPRLKLNLTLRWKGGGLPVAASNQEGFGARLSQSDGAKYRRLREKMYYAGRGNNKGYGAPMGTSVVTSWSYMLLLKSNVLSFKPFLNQIRERQFGNRTFMPPVF